MDIELINEEDVKVKIILPYLKSLGFSLSEIDFEKNLKIRLGRNEVPLSNGKSKNWLEGRLDLLCKKGNKNLFLIEVKSAGKNITKIDAEQGISYARLITPIPPFVIVTNGKKTHVYDVITKKELDGVNIDSQSAFWEDNCVLATDNELSIRYDALMNFIGYSPENLIAFTDSQIADRMQTLKGSCLDPRKKYIPELFLSRNDLIDNFTNFLDSSSQCFALIGESGVGKTNFICGLAEYFKSKHIVLFFNGTTLTKSVIDSIKDDFNWVFSSSLEGIEILRRIETLAKEINCKVCIFFDAVDECLNMNFNFELDEFVRRLKNFPVIKICISCKESEWENFLTLKGNPNYLSESIYESKGKESSTSNYAESGSNHGKLAQKPGYKIERFDNKELSRLEKKYRDFFNFKGSLSDELREECKLGFMIRVVGEVFQGKELSLSIDNIKLIRKYLDLRLKKFQDPDLALRYLVEIGKILIQKESTHKDDLFHDHLDEFELRNSLNLSITENISPELFSYNLLSYLQKEDGRKLIGFYYSKIRDYIISILSLNLDKLSDEEFNILLPNIMRGRIGQSSTYWYYSVAKQSHRAIFQDYECSRALIFVNHYVSTIEKHFPNLKDRFEPYTKSNIGILINSKENDFRESWALYPLEHDEEQLVQYFPFNLRDENGRILIWTKVSIIRGRWQSFFDKDPVEAAKRMIRDQLKKIVEEGRLNEENNNGLILEKILNIIYNYSKNLGIDSKNDIGFFSPFSYDFLPIKCDDIINKINLYYAKLYFLEKKLEENGGTLHHSKQLDLEIDKKAMDAIMNNIEIPQPAIGGDFPPVKVLRSSVEQYKKLDSMVSKSLLPLPDLKNKHDIMIHYEKKYKNLESYVMKKMGNKRIIQYTDGGLKEYIKEFFSIAIREYKILVETCFPSFKNELPFYSSLPITLFFEAKTKPELDWPLIYFYKSIKNSDSIIDGSVNPVSSNIPWKSYEYIISGTSFRSLFYSSYSFKLDKRLSPSRTDHMCVTRNWVLSKINEEIKYILDSFYANGPRDG